MQGRHIFGLIKDFCASTNKILVDYSRFKKWVFTKLMDHKKSLREEKRNKDPRVTILNEILS